MTDVPLIEQTITVANVKDVDYKRNDGSPAQFKSVGHKLPDGTWLNLSCFDEDLFFLLVPGSTLDVGYTEKYATNPNGSPKIDGRTGQQQVYRTITQARPVSGQTTAPPSSGAKSYNPELGAYQTALNCATQLHVAMLGAKIIKEVDLEGLLNMAGLLHGYLTTGNTEVIDLMLDAARPTTKESEETAQEDAIAQSTFDGS